MTDLTLATLKRIMPMSGQRAAMFLPHLNAAMREFDITTPERQAAFLSQIAHESMQLYYTREIASGIRYEGRKDLGNTRDGDGPKYRGRGLLQVTGRANYTACMLALDIDCIEHPELLERAEYAARSAGWFWKTHGLNELADKGDQVKVSRRINGGTNGLAERLALFDVAHKVLA